MTLYTVDAKRYICMNGSSKALNLLQFIHHSISHRTVKVTRVCTVNQTHCLTQLQLISLIQPCGHLLPPTSPLLTLLCTHSLTHFKRPWLCVRSAISSNGQAACTVDCPWQWSCVMFCIQHHWLLHRALVCSVLCLLILTCHQHHSSLFVLLAASTTGQHEDWRQEG